MKTTAQSWKHFAHSVPFFWLMLHTKLRIVSSQHRDCSQVAQRPPQHSVLGRGEERERGRKVTVKRKSLSLPVINFGGSTISPLSFAVSFKILWRDRAGWVRKRDLLARTRGLPGWSIPSFCCCSLHTQMVQLPTRVPHCLGVDTKDSTKKLWTSLKNSCLC
jgi:hypothetical protein